MLVNWNMSGCAPVSTPLALVEYAGSDADDVCTHPYRSLVGELQWLSTCTRSDIVNAVSVLSSHLSDPRMRHWIAAKRVLRYLAGSLRKGICYDFSSASPATPSDPTSLAPVAYVDSNWGGCITARCTCRAPLSDAVAIRGEPECVFARSRTGHFISFGGGIISCKSCLQTTTATSSTEGEYMALYDVGRDALWVTGLLKELGLCYPHPMVVWEDNMGAVHLANNTSSGSSRSRSRHISIKYHRSREWIVAGHFTMSSIPGSHNPSDLLTKPLGPTKFEQFVQFYVKDVY
jgi:hypothetical protein